LLTAPHLPDWQSLIWMKNLQVAWVITDTVKLIKANDNIPFLLTAHHITKGF
jgi:hypothetical protein